MGFESDSKGGTRNVTEYAADTIDDLVESPDPSTINRGVTADGHIAVWNGSTWVVSGGGGASGAGSAGATGASGASVIGASGAAGSVGATGASAGQEGSHPYTVAAGAVTVDVTYPSVTVTNDADSAVAITLATAGASDGWAKLVKFYDYSAAAQTISWVNTENSAVNVPTTSNGSTTLPLSVVFGFNGGTSKWRCLGVA